MAFAVREEESHACDAVRGCAGDRHELSFPESQHAAARSSKVRRSEACAAFNVAPTVPGLIPRTSPIAR